MSGPTMSMIDSSNAGIGNYKGVMLCNRPFGGTGGEQASYIMFNWIFNDAFLFAIGPKPEAKHDMSSFHAGKVPSALGSTVPIATLDKVYISLCSIVDVYLMLLNRLCVAYQAT